MSFSLYILPCIIRVLTACTKINECCGSCINAVWRKVAYRLWITNGQWLNQTTGKVEIRCLEDTPYYISNLEILDIESIL